MLKEVNAELKRLEITDNEKALNLFIQMDNKWVALYKLVTDFMPIKLEGFRVLARKYFPKLKELNYEV